MRMSELARELPIESQDGRPAVALGVDVGGIAYDSRRVEAGDLFVAWRGEVSDGSAFAAEAVRRGAVAVLTPPDAAIEVPVPHLVADDPRRLLGPLAARLHAHPDRELLHVGVTGTNGKSTVTALLVAILEADGRVVGQIGTLGYRLGELDLDELNVGDGRTTPEGSDYFRLLRAMRDAGADAVVAEVSSHALAQGRVAGGRYDLALFTNLTRDHLDFHGDMESYFAAKRILFRMLAGEGRAAVGVDDPFGSRLRDELSDAVAFGADSSAAVRPLEVDRDVEGLRARLATPRGRIDITSGLVGDYNLANILAAVAGAEALELDRTAIVDGIAACRPLAGRMELVSSRGALAAFVDFAHTPAALGAALESARSLGDGRLIVVFGCGGDRDRGKRVPMGRAAGELADLAIVTSDNPRSESPDAIVEDVLPGLEASGGEFEIRVDRREAIRFAVQSARPGDVVLVAGKGHERTQTLGDRTIPFSDQDELLEALEDRLGPSKAG